MLFASSPIELAPRIESPSQCGPTFVCSLCLLAWVAAPFARDVVRWICIAVFQDFDDAKPPFPFLSYEAPVHWSVGRHHLTIGQQGVGLAIRGTTRDDGYDRLANTDEGVWWRSE